jgi:hypothetical protein
VRSVAALERSLGTEFTKFRSGTLARPLRQPSRDAAGCRDRIAGFDSQSPSLRPFRRTPARSLPTSTWAQRAGGPSFTQNQRVHAPWLSLTAINWPPRAFFGNLGPRSATLMACGVIENGELSGPISFGIRKICAALFDVKTPPLSLDDAPENAGARVAGARDADTGAAAAGNAWREGAGSRDARAVRAFAHDAAVATDATHARAGSAAIADDAGNIFAFPREIACRAILVPNHTVHSTAQHTRRPAPADGEHAGMHVAFDVLVPGCGVGVSGNAVEPSSDDTVAFGNGADGPASREAHRSGRMDGIDAVRVLREDLVTFRRDVEDEVRLISIRITIDRDQETALFALVRTSDGEVVALLQLHPP